MTKVDNSFANISNEKLVELFNDMGIEIDRRGRVQLLPLPAYDEDDEGVLFDEY